MFLNAAVELRFLCVSMSFWRRKNKIVGTSKMLAQAREKKKKLSEIYYEIGFENLSHFSFAFKKHFGYAPIQVFHQQTGLQEKNTALLVVEENLFFHKFVSNVAT